LGCLSLYRALVFEKLRREEGEGSGSALCIVSAPAMVAVIGDVAFDVLTKALLQVTLLSVSALTA
jgi:hypothetical protein